MKTVTEKDLLEEASGKGKKGAAGDNARKPITISSRLRSPLGVSKKGNVRKDGYESPYNKEKNYRL